MTACRFLSCLAASALLMTGCGDDAHKGTISHGSAPPPQVSGAPPQEQATLKLDPGTPLMCTLVARRLRKRLAPLGVGAPQVRIDGAEVEAEVPTDKLAEAQRGLGTGHLDILLAEAERDLLSGTSIDDAAKPFSRKPEVVAGPHGERSLHYLVATPPERDALATYLQSKLGRRGVIGPLFAGDTNAHAFRSYQAQDGRLVRGEHIVTVTVHEQDGVVSLRTTFTPAAGAGLRWHIQHGTGFLFYADREVLSRITPKALADGDSLSFPLQQRKDAQATRAAAESIAKQLNGISLSHHTKLLPTK